SSLTGDTLEIYEVGYDVVSLVELGGELFAMTKGGDFYSFDAASGESLLIGRITGAGDSLIGATVPSPGGALALIGLLGVSCTRRRG
ncbi:MAG: hypothetical protein ACF8LL_09220, partial [Phycisphaerales bacterium]